MNIKFENEDGTNHVEPGIQQLLGRMRTGRFKVFSTCDSWFKEFRRYHRKNGKIVKEHDDEIDASRYGALTVARYGSTMADARQGSNQSHAIDWDY